jgi:ethanolamine utilization protein EutQ
VTANRKRSVTAADVRAASAAGQRALTVPASGVVTPLAADTARELGVELRRDGTRHRAPTEAGADTASDDLERRVRHIVTAVIGSGDGAEVTAGRRRVRHVDGRSVTLDPFPYEGPEPGQDVRAADVVTSADGSPVAAGFLALTRGCFPWTLTYDEVQYVIEGELHLGTPDGVVVGRPGDVLYVPRGTEVTFGTPSWARFLYVTFPADWEEQLR